ncbi:hypothetical protein, partial [Paraburkholderia nemoris]|uniref:hypothetical protein n=1 Tax=Paraburkholderia nemoris TaxID=2793076 RepID=UPI001B8A962B
ARLRQPHDVREKLVRRSTGTSRINLSAMGFAKQGQGQTATSTTNRYFNYQLLLQLPTATSTTNCYFNYQLQQHTLTTSTATHWYYCLHHQNYYSHYELLNTRGSAAPYSKQRIDQPTVPLPSRCAAPQK